MSCCEVMGGGIFRFNQIDDESAFSEIDIDFVSRTKLWFRSRTRWWSQCIQGLRRRRRPRPCGGAGGETEVTMQLLWAGWSRFGPLMELVWWAWASGMVLGQFWSFVSLCFLVRLCLGFWIGISPSSFGRGFECRFLVNVLLRWCYSWGLSALILVRSGWQHEGGLPLHVVWWYLDTVWKKENLLVLVLAARLYRYSQDCVALF